MITVCGEGVVDLVEEQPGVFRAYPGGSPLNVAVGVAALGRPASLLGRLGVDRFGQVLREHLTGHGVSMRDVVDATEPTSLAVVSVDAAGKAAYDFYVQGTADWGWGAADLAGPLRGDVVALHAGSLASCVEPGAQVIEALVRRERARGAVTLTYDPNVRPVLMGERAAAVDRVSRWVGLVDLVKVSDEDLAWLYPGRAAAVVAGEWARSGPALVVVTCGSDGAFAVTGSGVVVRRRARRVRVVDTVGAGDAFTAGLLDALFGAGLLGVGGREKLSGLTAAGLADVLDHAGLVAALTCERAGATPPSAERVAAAAAGRWGVGSGLDWV